MELKLLTNEEKKVAIKAELLTGANARKLAEKYDIHYTTVIKYRNEQRNNIATSEVVEVAEVDKVALHMVAKEVKAKVAIESGLPPQAVLNFDNKVDDIVSGVNSLQLLDTAFHKTITGLLNWANTQISDDMSIKDWRIIATQIGELHTAIFSKGTTVNVQQNNTSNFSTGMVN